VPQGKRACIAGFIEALFKLYVDMNFAYLEINPLVVAGGKVTPLDLAAKLDSTADFESAQVGRPRVPEPFGREPTKEEAFIEELDAKTGASLKLTVLNPEGRVWTMVAGGGASVIFADTITDLGFMDEMANYGEYSGDPSEEFTYLYAKTILDLMTRTKHPDGKVLLIGGGIANFTDVANTFKGIIRALREYKTQLQDGTCASTCAAAARTTARAADDARARRGARGAHRGVRPRDPHDQDRLDRAEGA
jgi:ATP citrate (pro-S)-lyase